MTAVVTDVNLPARLRDAQEAIRVVDENGHFLGTFEPSGYAPPGWAKAHSPTTREELERLRQKCRETREGSSLADILARLPGQTEVRS